MALPPPRILIVEDHPAMVQMIRQRLIHLGYQPVGDAAQGARAIALIEEHQPDLVLMDINLSGEMDGIQTARHIQERFDVPVIFLTAETGGEILNQAKTAEPYGYIIKPFGDNDLRAGIELALYKHIAQSQRKRAEAALQAAQEQLARANQDLERLVRERTARLEETVREIELFSYSLIHDMRAPLRALHGYAGILLEEYGPSLDQVRQDYLLRIASAADRMDHLIVDALNYLKVIQPELTLTTIDAATLLRDMIKSYPALQSPHADIAVADPFPPVLANKAALTQCFSNLLNQAIRGIAPSHTPRVRVWTETRGERVRFWFEGPGSGPSQADPGRHLETDLRENQETSGPGLDLTMVHKVAQRMRGIVGVETTPGQGRRFWLELQGGP